MRSLGVDVGLRKGLDLVLLDEQRQVVRTEARLPHGRFREVVLDWSPDVVAIDSPPRWASVEAIRQTEAAVLRLGIQLYVTPAEDRRSATGFHDWMVAGMDAFRAIEDRYPLYRGDAPQATAMEVFPHATAVVLAGGLMPAGLTKRAWRRQVLVSQGISQQQFRTNDQVDACLAALTGLYVLEGNACCLGDPAEGAIVLPCKAEVLPAAFLKLGSGGQPVMKTGGRLSCPSCRARNPRRARFCNQCGARLDPSS